MDVHRSGQAGIVYLNAGHAMCTIFPPLSVDGFTICAKNSCPLRLRAPRVRHQATLKPKPWRTNGRVMAFQVQRYLVGVIKDRALTGKFGEGCVYDFMLQGRSVGSSVGELVSTRHDAISI